MSGITALEEIIQCAELGITKIPSASELKANMDRLLEIERSVRGSVSFRREAEARESKAPQLRLLESSKESKGR
jgi:hypothetical protein